MNKFIKIDNSLIIKTDSILNISKEKKCHFWCCEYLVVIHIKNSPSPIKKTFKKKEEADELFKRIASEIGLVW